MRALILTVLFATSVLSMPVEDEGSTAEPVETTKKGRGMYGKYYQGDIVLTPEQEQFFRGETDELSQRTGLKDPKRLWPKEDGVVTVPVTFSEKLYTPEHIEIIINGLQEIENNTCIRFVERTFQDDYIYIFSGDGCWSPLGKTGGKQRLSLEIEGCVHHQAVLHETIHALGYDHMHNHEDRDEFVTIYLEHVDNDEQYNFNKGNGTTFSNYNTPYDYESVMHYWSTAFSVDGKDTMVPTDLSYKDIIGNVKNLSSGDIERLNNMYKCNEVVTDKEEVTNNEEGTDGDF